MKDNGTLLFCTSYFRDAAEWQSRYARWIEHHQALPYLYHAMVMIDDGSPYEPERSPLTPVRAADIGKRSLPARALVRFPNNLGRSGTTLYPGWCRSFLFSLDIAESYSFSKIVHVESDTYLLSSVIVDYIDRTNSGWVAFWSPAYGFPETALQIICADAYPAFATVRDAGPRAFEGQPAEKVLPFTKIERSFVGDRYSEIQPTIPPNADYAVQVGPSMYTWAPRSFRHQARRLFARAHGRSLQPVRGPRVPDADDIARMSDHEARECAYRAGLLAYERGYLDSARRCLERAAGLDPENAKGRLLLAVCCLNLGDLRTALAQGLAARQIDPNDADTENLIGATYAFMGSAELAIEHYLKSIDIDPTKPEPLMRIRALENALQKGSARADLAEASMRAQLLDRLKIGELNERGYRTLLSIRKRGRDELREFLPVANVVATYQTLDLDEVRAIDEIFDAAGDRRRRDEFRAHLVPWVRQALEQGAGLSAPARTT